jgi:iron complex outermembrane receptor protein
MGEKARCAGAGCAAAGVESSTRKVNYARRRGFAAGLTGLPALCIAIVGAMAPTAGAAQSIEELRGLSIEELTNVEVTSVFKRPEPLTKTPAAIYVVSGDDIRRSGAVSLPEALRLAPNLNVARVDARSYAISARGFNSFEASNKLLVMIDGRSVYTPLHGGVFWDEGQVMLSDVERIEVVRGPGGTLWGANAVNGVINVITKSARDTQGALADVRLGTLDRGGSVRYGGPIGDAGAFRIYGMGFKYGETLTSTGADANDDWSNLQAGFRSDFRAGANAFTVQGDIYENDFDPDGDNSGKNVLGRWSRRLGAGSTVELQAYYNDAKRLSPGVTDKLETFDIAGQHTFSPFAGHEIVWGGGYRRTEDLFINTLNPFVLDPESDTIQLGNGFVQDSIALHDDVTVTVGTKIEYSSYTGVEYLPSGRVAWELTDTALLWGAVSRAVRTPSRIDRDLVWPGVFERAGSRFDSEKLIAYEMGYRVQPTPESVLSIALFYNDYDDLRILATSDDSGLLTFANKMEGHTYGIEAWGDYRVFNWWRLSAGFNLLEKNLHLEPGAVETAISQHAGNDPEYQGSLRSYMDLTERIELDVGLRAVDSLPNPPVPSYVAVDARIGWRLTDTFEISVGAQNVFDKSHPETGAEATRREIRRSAYVGARWRF